jgi:hypothetical protein
MCGTPSTASAVNHRITTGPNTMPPALRHEHADKNHDRDRHHDGVEDMRGDAESFDGAEHRDCRRNHAIAIEQGGAEQSHRDQRAAPVYGGLRPDQRDERENTALALVVGAQHEQEVLHRHDQNQRPHDQREDAEHVRRGHRNLVRARKALPQGVQRTRPDVAVDDPKRRQDQEGNS